MRKKQPLPIEKVHIEKLVHGGQGLGILPDGKKCFVWGALPGEEANVRLTRKKKDWAEGYVVEILTASPDRISPEEPEIYLATSPWQILDYDKESFVKQAILNESFIREGIELEWQEFYQQPTPYHYRNKMEYNFWFDTDTNQVSLALHRRGSHQKVEVQGSALASDAINTAGKELIKFINQNNIEARPLKSVILRSSANGMVGISLFVNDKAIAKKFVTFNAHNVIFEILYSDPRSPASVSTEVILPAEQRLTDTLLGRTFSYSTRSFFQGNIDTYEKVLEIISRIASTTHQNIVIEMYSGIGSIGLTVTPKDKQLKLVEVDTESVEQAKLNIGDRQNVELVHATAESALDYIDSDALIIVDPPRAGLHKEVVAKLAEAKPETIIYLSCNPSTQARDIKELVAAGYKISYAQGFNFFPRTPHIESLCIMEYIV